MPQQYQVASRTLFDLFLQLSSHPFIFIEPGGNAGDYLIYKGAYKLAEQAHLQYATVIYGEDRERLSAVPDDHVIYIHGGGGFVPWWSGKPISALKKLAATFKGIVIVGPTTFSEDPNYLKAVFIDSISQGRCRKLFIFTREHTSYRVLRKYLPPWVELMKDHDTALNLQPGDFGKAGLRQRYSFYAIRTDKEMCADQRADIFPIRLDPASWCRTFEEWFLMHAAAKEIVTNRLHSSILGSILGKQTTLLPNSYHKNRSVWEFSLSGRGVGWQERLPLNRLNMMFPERSLIRRLRFSTFTQRLIKSYFLRSAKWSMCR